MKGGGRLLRGLTSEDTHTPPRELAASFILSGSSGIAHALRPVPCAESADRTPRPWNATLLVPKGLKTRAQEDLSPLLEHVQATKQGLCCMVTSQKRTYGPPGCRGSTSGLLATCPQLAASAWNLEFPTGDLRRDFKLSATPSARRPLSRAASCWSATTSREKTANGFRHA